MKIKINWGTGIVIAIALFIAFIMYMVVTMLTNKGYDHDLVTENYYKKELDFQGDIDAFKKANSLPEKVIIYRVEKGLKVQFPKTFKPDELKKGKVFLYRPSNKQLDFELPITLTNSFFLIPEERLIGGRWNVFVSWIYKNERYLVKKELEY